MPKWADRLAKFAKTLDASGGAPGGSGGGGTASLAQSYVGHNVVGASWDVAGANNKVYMKQVVLPSDCLVSSIAAYIQHASGSAAAPAVALYADNAGVPGRLLAYGGPATNVALVATTPRWVDVPLGAWVIAGTYWLAIRTTDLGLSASVVLQVAYDGSGSDKTATGTAAQWADGSAYTFTTTTSKFSIRANVVAAAAGGGGGSMTVSDGHGASVAGVTEIKFGTLWVASLGGGVVVVDSYLPLTYPLDIPWSTNGFNGVFNTMGLNVGGGTFANPHPAKYTATQSTNQDGTRTADKATDHSTDGNNGCTHTQSGSNQWWKADMQLGRTMTVTRFGILGRGGGTHPGAFVLQGSNDDSAWTDLLTVATPGIVDNTWSSWPVIGAGAYRYLRVLQTVSNYLVLGDVEMWGTLA